MEDAAPIHSKGRGFRRENRMTKEHTTINRLWDREEVIALRERAQAIALDVGMSVAWQRAYQHLADALDYVDAITARCEVRSVPLEESGPLAEHHEHWVGRTKL